MTPGPGARRAAARARYLPYSASALRQPGRKVLFFHAAWCSQCRAIERSIYQQGVPAGWTILKVDYDSNQALRRKYGVTLQTTFVKVDSAGRKIASYVAYRNPSIAAVRRDFLN